jgi:hypothetical protein
VWALAAWATVAALAAAGVLSSGVTNAQSMFRGDAAHTGAYGGAGPRQFHRVKWKFPTGDRIVSSPVHKDGVIYFGGDDGNVYAVAAADGHQLWKHKMGGPVPSSPAVEGETLYVGGYDGKFHALDTRTGATRWKFATGGERRFEAKGLHGFQPKSQTIPDAFDVFLSSPVVARGTVYFGSGDGHVYAIDAASGELKWKFTTGDVVHASPAYADEPSDPPPSAKLRLPVSSAQRPLTIPELVLNPAMDFALVHQGFVLMSSLANRVTTEFIYVLTVLNQETKRVRPSSNGTFFSAEANCFSLTKVWFAIPRKLALPDQYRAADERLRLRFRLSNTPIALTSGNAPPGSGAGPARHLSLPLSSPPARQRHEAGCAERSA